MKQVNKFYKRYQYLVGMYVSKIEITDQSIEICDLEQELRIRLYTAIIAYGKKWGNYRKTGKMKPIPIEFYLKTVLNNKMIDIYKSSKRKDQNCTIICDKCGSVDVKKTGVSKSPETQQRTFSYQCNKCSNHFHPNLYRNDNISKEYDKMDVGYTPIISTIDFRKKVVVIEGYDFLQNMSVMEKACMCMFFKGYEKMKIGKIFKNHFDRGYNGVIDFIDETVTRFRQSNEIKQLMNEIYTRQLCYVKSGYDED